MQPFTSANLTKGLGQSLRVSFNRVSDSQSVSQSVSESVTPSARQLVSQSVSQPVCVSVGFNDVHGNFDIYQRILTLPAPFNL